MVNLGPLSGISDIKGVKVILRKISFVLRFMKVVSVLKLPFLEQLEFLGLSFIESSNPQVRIKKP
jgi:hypothetical protein